MSGFSGTRRDVLRRGAAAVGAATVAGNAGCMGLLGSGGGYAQWVPEPGTMLYWLTQHTTVQWLQQHQPCPPGTPTLHAQTRPPHA